MKHDDGTGRRRFLRGAASLAGGAVLASTFSRVKMFAQDPPTCPTPPSGGAHFVPGSDTRPITLRKSIGSLSPAELTQIKNAYAALRALPATDKRTWILQADMHALYCAQCTDSVMDIHGSWSFFPWHRAYLYYYERILGSLVGDLAHFRLPYWDWENIRSLPPGYNSPSNATNSLWDAKRNATLAGGGTLPVTDGTQARINTLYGITDFATFGGDAGTGGSVEANPHGTIHNDTGQSASPWEDMGNLGYAARDPIFFAHHDNIDKLWSGWNDLASGGGLPPNAYKNPTDPAFLNMRWSFYDETQALVSISAADVLDHNNHLRYTYKAPTFVIPHFVYLLECELICCIPGPDPGPFLQVSEKVREEVLTEVKQQTEMVLVLEGVTVPAGITGNLDVFAVREDRRVNLGSIGLIAHAANAGQEHKHENRPMNLVLDITAVAADLLAKEKPATLRVFKRPAEIVGRGVEAERLRANQKLEEPFQLKARRAEIRISRKK